MEYGKQLDQRRSYVKIAGLENQIQFIKDMQSIGVPVCKKELNENAHGKSFGVIFYEGSLRRVLNESWDKEIPREEFIARLFNRWEEPEPVQTEPTYEIVQIVIRDGDKLVRFNREQ